MNARIMSKQIKQGYRPFHDTIAQYNSKIRNCKRWRNLRKAQRMWALSIDRYFKAKLARH